MDNSELQYKEIFEGHQKKIDCTHELIFNITANILKQNDDGIDISSEGLCAKNYHIPIKDGMDYKPFLDAFFLFLENCLANSAEHAFEKSNNGINNDK